MQPRNRCVRHFDGSPRTTEVVAPSLVRQMISSVHSLDCAETDACQAGVLDSLAALVVLRSRPVALWTVCLSFLENVHAGGFLVWKNDTCALDLGGSWNGAKMLFGLQTPIK
ncbi:hypothetical protein ACLOJK_009470 [Asimina triloba]